MAYKVTNPLMCTEKEARNVLDFMQDQIEKKGFVTVKEMYNFVWMLDKLRGKMDHAYGWENLRAASVEYNSREGCYEVLTPVPVAL
jgi:hypothetical protein